MLEREWKEDRKRLERAFKSSVNCKEELEEELEDSLKFGPENRVYFELQSYSGLICWNCKVAEK